jgi:hypothetical protein
MSNNSSSGGLGIGSVLTIVFVVLKLVGVINWSWWWVLSPLWISFALFLVVVILFLVAAAVGNVVQSRKP